MKVDMSGQVKAKQWFALRQKAWVAFTDDFFPERDNDRMTDAQSMVIMSFFSILTFVATLLIEPPTLDNSSMEYCALSDTIRHLSQLPFIVLACGLVWKLCTEIRSYFRDVLNSRFDMFLIRVFIAIALVGLGWSIAARLQQWPHAVVITAEHQRYEGQVTRELFSGNYLVEVSPDHLIRIKTGDLGVMTWVSKDSPVTRASTIAFFAGLLGAVLFLFPGFIKRKF